MSVSAYFLVVGCALAVGGIAYALSRVSARRSESLFVAAVVALIASLIFTGLALADWGKPDPIIRVQVGGHEQQP